MVVLKEGMSLSLTRGLFRVGGSNRDGIVVVVVEEGGGGKGLPIDHQMPLTTMTVIPRVGGSQFSVFHKSV